MRKTRGWKQSGVVVLWRYRDPDRSDRGWHLTADRAGCRSLLELLDAFSAEGVAGSRVLKLSEPTPMVLAVPNHRRCDSVSPSKLRIAFSETPSEWSFPPADERAELVVGAEWLPGVTQGIADVAAGHGDYRVGKSDDRTLPLWFWWWPGDG